IEIKVLDLPNENKDAVYERMITERNNIAAAYTAQGQSEAQIIRNTTDKEVAVMKSEAQAKADTIIAEGEAQYMQILSEAYNDATKADFYLFTKALDTAKEALKDGETTLFLDKDSPIAQIFQGIE
ncbi:MAG: protease modulator HflC, partial [Lachnospiraceae bacterium]|nr:protease modulator HflC [Lachnospiraceae bacterium]